MNHQQLHQQHQHEKATQWCKKTCWKETSNCSRTNYTSWFQSQCSRTVESGRKEKEAEEVKQAQKEQEEAERKQRQAIILEERRKTKKREMEGVQEQLSNLSNYVSRLRAGGTEDDDNKGDEEKEDSDKYDVYDVNPDIDDDIIDDNNNATILNHQSTTYKPPPNSSLGTQQ